MLKIKWLRRLVLLLAFLFFIAALEKNGVVNTTAPPAKNTAQDSLIILTDRQWITLDPAMAADPQSAKIINNIFEGLVKYKPGSVEVEPALATGWQVEQDGRVWIFHLRRGVKFHDNTPFNAQAVKFSVERVMAGKEIMPYSEMVFGMVDKVEVLNDYTVKFVLKYPYAPFLQNLAMPWAAPMVSPTAVKKLGLDFGRSPVGTGPFQLQKWQDERLVLTANENHWKQAPFIKKVLFQAEADNRERLKKLATGRVDIVDNIYLPKLSAKQLKNTVPVQQTSASINYLGFYTDKAPFNSSRLRRAVTMAVNREKLVQELYNGSILPAESYIPAGIPGHSKKLTQYPYNIDECKKLLEQNGYAGGMNLTLITYQGPRPYNPAGGEKLAQAIKKQLALAGINVKIKVYPWPEYKRALKRREGDCFLYGWVGDNGDPDNFLYTLLTTPQIKRGLNPAGYSNPQVDRMLASARQVTDPKLRQRIYYHAQQIILQDAPWILFNYGYDSALITKNVKNFKLQPTGGYYLYGIYKS
ncbi:peptide/nickel transport system substrate-binding protein [Desulfohalotomaculum tongense]|uniref:ABC transporter substrate-binding protein n=1 Tax=Desulforadius tongensis TaxID=1216062 RepID=UPI0019578ED2|nr:ABC transporter substrate-binding protein [Desulforadius tongensis]MBM7855672.1 peptide/nickel transport system substrate-binding protein [Desulforadius tongensis]